MALDIINALQVAVLLAFCTFIGYGAFLIIRDKERDWKARYGNRWIVTPSERARLDAEYEKKVRDSKTS
tara:strand:+ start:954 stop:1160 length:207 start_codon:yes stop_codon:yes gene_type:complete